MEILPSILLRVDCTCGTQTCWTSFSCWSNRPLFLQSTLLWLSSEHASLTPFSFLIPLFAVVNEFTLQCNAFPFSFLHSMALLKFYFCGFNHHLCLSILSGFNLLSDLWPIYSSVCWLYAPVQTSKVLFFPFHGRFLPKIVACLNNTTAGYSVHTRTRENLQILLLS